MNMLSMLKLLQAGQLPTSHASVMDCLTLCSFELVTIYMEGNSALASHLDHLFSALENKNDPMVKNMDFSTRQMMQMALEQFKSQKEKINAAKTG